MNPAEGRRRQREMDVRELEERQGELQIIDVREPYEWEAGRMEGSVLIPLNTVLSGGEDGQLDPSRPVAVLCKSGNRSELAATMLRARGYDAQNVEGGLEAWEDAGHACLCPDGSPGRVL
jgi:rhodanese-related sulfurtransferase